LFHHRRAGVEVFVNAVAKTHQAIGIVLVLGARDEFGDTVGRANFLEHFKTSLIGPAMRRPPQTGDTGGDTGKRIGTGGGGQTHGRGRGVLFMIRMQRENPVHRPRKNRVHVIGFRRHSETHVQEIRRIIQIVARIDERLANRIFIGHRGNRRHLGDQAD
jgi:hypothetical protein